MTELEVKTQNKLVEDIKGYLDAISMMLDTVDTHPEKASYYIQRYADYIKGTAQVLVES